MLLGHWYLNAPGMQLAPLRRLIALSMLAVAIHGGLAMVGVVGEISAAESTSVTWILFLVLRWAFGLVGLTLLLWMAWQTLRIPNTQSATGILYVAVTAAFAGELMGLLLSGQARFSL
jgi:hypothetical protein